MSAGRRNTRDRPPERGDRIVIVGGSAAGLTTGLLLARGGHEVEVFDRDALEPAADRDTAAKDAFRAAAPHLVHSHQYMPLAVRILRERLPDVYAALLAAGAVETPIADRFPPTVVDRSPRPGDEDLTALQARRSTLDWVLRAAAAEQDGLRLTGRAHVTGLLAEPGDPPRVTGVRTARGARHADVVIDAAGRRSPVDEWLAQIGARPARVTASECGIGYYTRHYRLRPGARTPARGRLSVVAFPPYLTVAAFTGDDDTLTVSLCPLVEDRPLRALRSSSAHHAVARRLPPLDEWLDISDPTSEVYAMGGLRNTLRRLVVDGCPVALGLHAVGDAVCTTNPTLGRGLSLALQSAIDVACLLDDHPDDPTLRARALDEAVAEHIEPWYADQVAMDSARLSAIRRDLGGRPAAPLPDPVDRITPAHLRAAAMVDADVFRAFSSVIAMVRTSAEVCADAATGQRVRDVLARRIRVPLPRPTRHELLATIEEAL